MAEAESTKNTPAYGSFKTLVSFLNEVREGGHVPLQIDRTLMPKLSGSAISETISSLKFLGLARGEKTVTPTAKFEKFAMASDEDRKELLQEILREAYPSLLAAPDFDIERASGQQVADIFRSQGVNGSTLTRAISFFLAASKDAGIKVSHNVKAPKPVPASTRRREKKVEPTLPPTAAPARPHIDEASEETEDLHRFEIPIPGKPSVRVLVPESLDADDWAMLTQMFGIYVERWKRFTRSPNNDPGGD